MVKTDTIYSFIKVKGINKYILSVLADAKIVFILLINLCSRMQKLKFKTDYKSTTKNKTWLFLNFIFTFLLYAFISVIILILAYRLKKHNEQNDNNEMDENNNINNYNNNVRKKNINIFFEQSIIFYIGLDFLYVFIISLIFRLKKNCDEIIVYISIIITGSINFILYDYYSLQKVEYISLSGIVSLAHTIFRFVDYFCSPFKSYKNYSLQMGFSLGGIFLILFYFFVFLKRSINFCICF